MTAYTPSAPVLYFATDGIVSWGTFLVSPNNSTRNVVIEIEKISPLEIEHCQNLNLSIGDVLQILTKTDEYAEVFCVRTHLSQIPFSNGIVLNVFLLEKAPEWRIFQLKETKIIPTMESGIVIRRNNVSEILVSYITGELEIMCYEEMRNLPIEVIAHWYRVKECDINR